MPDDLTVCNSIPPRQVGDYGALYHMVQGGASKKRNGSCYSLLATHYLRIVSVVICVWLLLSAVICVSAYAATFPKDDERLLVAKAEETEKTLKKIHKKAATAKARKEKEKRREEKRRIGESARKALEEQRAREKVRKRESEQKKREKELARQKKIEEKRRRGESEKRRKKEEKQAKLKEKKVKERESEQVRKRENEKEKKKKELAKKEAEQKRIERKRLQEEQKAATLSRRQAGAKAARKAAEARKAATAKTQNLKEKRKEEKRRIGEEERRRKREAKRAKLKEKEAKKRESEQVRKRESEKKKRARKALEEQRAKEKELARQKRVARKAAERQRAREEKEKARKIAEQSRAKRLAEKRTKEEERKRIKAEKVTAAEPTRKAAEARKVVEQQRAKQQRAREKKQLKEEKIRLVKEKRKQKIEQEKKAASRRLQATKERERERSQKIEAKKKEREARKAAERQRAREKLHAKKEAKQRKLEEQARREAEKREIEKKKKARKVTTAEAARKALEEQRAREKVRKRESEQRELTRIKKREEKEAEKKIKDERERRIEGYYTAGKHLYREEKYQQAIGEFEKILGIAPEEARAQRYIATAKAQNLKEKRKEEKRRVGEAEKRRRKAADAEARKKKESRREEEEKIIIMGLYAQGKGLYKESKFEEARLKFKEILAVAPEYEGAPKFAPLIRDYKGANKYLARIEEKLAVLPPEALKRERKAATAKAQKEKERRKKEVEKYYKQGKRYYKDKEYEEAIIAFEKVLELNHRHEKARKYLEVTRKRQDWARERERKIEEMEEEEILRISKEAVGRYYKCFASPVILEDANTLRKKQLELEAFNEKTIDERGEDYYDWTSDTWLGLNYGITDRLEVGMAADIISSHFGRYVTDEAAFGNMTTHLKWQFLEEGRRRPALATKFKIKIPTGDEDKGLSTGEADFRIDFLASKDIGPGNYHFNLGYDILGNPSGVDYANEIHYGLAAYYPIRRIALGIEAAGKTDKNRGGDKMDIYLGGKFRPTKDFEIRGAIGDRISNKPPDILLKVGLVYYFKRKTKEEKEAPRYYKIGKRRYRHKRYRAAKEELMKALALNPEHLDAAKYLAKAQEFIAAEDYFLETKEYLAADDYEKAKEALAKSIDLKANYPLGKKPLYEKLEKVTAAAWAAKEEPIKAHYGLGKSLYKYEEYHPALQEFRKVLSLNPRHKKALEYVARIQKKVILPQERVDRAEECLVRGEYGKAKEELALALRLNPRHEEAKALLVRLEKIEKVERRADVEAERREGTRAKKEMLKRRQEIAEHYRLGKELYGKKNYQEARGEFEEVLALVPEHPRARHYLDEIQEEIKREEEEAQRKLIETKEEKIARYIEQGKTYYKAGNYSEAQETFQQVLVLEPRQLTAKRYLAKTQEKMECELSRIKKERELSRIRREKKEGKIREYLTLGRDYYNRDEYQKALKEFQKALSLNAEHEEAKRYLSEAQSAIERERMALALRKKEEPYRRTQVAQHYSQGLGFYKEGRQEEAKTEFKEVLLLEPTHSGTKRYLEKIGEEKKRREEIERKYALGKRLYVANKYQEAKEPFKRVLALNPKHKGAKEYLAKIATAEAQKVREERKRKKEQARQKEEERRKIEEYLALGKRYHKKGEYQKAIVEFEKALILNPEHSKASQYLILSRRFHEAEEHFTQAKQYLKDNKYEEAKIELRRSLKLNPDNPDAKRLLKELRLLTE